MKTLLIPIFFASIIACGSRTDKQQTNDKPMIEYADTEQLYELLEVDGQQHLSTNSAKPKPRLKTVSFQSLKPTPCNIEVVLYTYENIDSLSTDAIDMFLKIFTEECNRNVEFSQFSQEMIFEVFSKYPKEVAELISRDDYNVVALTSELESPLLDPVIEPIITDIRATGIRHTKIDSIVAALERGVQYLNDN